MPDTQQSQAITWKDNGISTIGRGPHGETYIYIPLRVVNHANVMLWTYGLDKRGIPGIRHLAEHVSCTGDKTDNEGYAKRIKGVNNETLLNGLRASGDDRFGPTGSANATTRENNACFYTCTLADETTVWEQWDLYVKQVLTSKVCPERLATEDLVTREASAVRAEAARGESTCADLINEFNDLSAIEMGVNTKAAVIGNNGMETAEAQKMLCVKQGTKLLLHIRQLFAADNLSSTAFIVTSGDLPRSTEPIVELSTFKERAQTCAEAIDACMVFRKLNPTPDLWGQNVYNPYDEPQRTEDDLRSLHESRSSTIESNHSVKAQGVALRILGFSGVPNAFEDSVHYHILKEIMCEVEQKMKEVASVYQVMWDGVGRSPSFSFILGPKEHPKEFPTIQEKLFKTISNVTQEQFTTALAKLNKEWREWSTDTTFMEKLPNLLSTYENAGKSMDYIFQRQTDLQKVNWKTWNEYFTERIFPHMVNCHRVVTFVSNDMYNPDRVPPPLTYTVRGQSSSDILVTPKFVNYGEILSDVEPIMEPIMEPIPGEKCIVLLRLESNDQLLAMIMKSIADDETGVVADDIGFALQVQVEVPPTELAGTGTLLTNILKSFKEVKSERIHNALRALQQRGEDITHRLTSECHSHVMRSNTLSPIAKAGNVSEDTVRKAIGVVMTRKAEIIYFLPTAFYGGAEGTEAEAEAEAKAEAERNVENARASYKQVGRTMLDFGNREYRIFKKQWTRTVAADASASKWAKAKQAFIAVGDSAGALPVQVWVPFVPTSIYEMIIYEVVSNFFAHGGWNSMGMALMRRHFNDVYGITSTIAFPRFIYDCYCLVFGTEFHPSKAKKGCEDLNDTVDRFFRALEREKWSATDPEGRCLDYWIRQAWGIFKKQKSMANGYVYYFVHCRDLNVSMKEYGDLLKGLSTASLADDKVWTPAMVSVTEKLMDAKNANGVLSLINVGSNGVGLFKNDEQHPM